MQHQQYFLMLERAPGYFWVEFFVQESKRFMVEQNLILFYPWCYYATQKYPFMRSGGDGGGDGGGGDSGGVTVAAVTAAAAAAAATITAAEATASAAGTDNNQLKAVTAMANAGGD
jgi:hypothetical protein